MVSNMIAEWGPNNEMSSSVWLMSIIVALMVTDTPTNEDWYAQVLIDILL